MHIQEPAYLPRTMPLSIQKNSHDPPSHTILTIFLSLPTEALKLSGGLWV